MPKVIAISECPRCLSRHTGIIQFDFEPTEKMVRRYAKKGCYIKQYPPSDHRKYPIPPNSFCSECHYEWVGTHKTKRLSLEEYCEYLEERNLDEDSINIPRKFPKLSKVFSLFWNVVRWR